MHFCRTSTGERPVGGRVRTSPQVDTEQGYIIREIILGDPHVQKENSRPEDIGDMCLMMSSSIRFRPRSYNARTTNQRHGTVGVITSVAENDASLLARADEVIE